MDVISSLADKNIPGTYSRVVVDTAEMSTTVYQYALKADGTGEYTVARMGDGVQSMSPIALTWLRGAYSDNKAYIGLSILTADSKAWDVNWSSVTLFEGKEQLAKGDRIGSIKSVFTDFASTCWAATDSAWFIEPYVETFKYLKWKQSSPTKSWLTDAQIEEKREYYAQQWVKDTIRWYNDNFFYNDTYKVGKIAAPIPDSIQVKDTVDAKGRHRCIYYEGSAASLKLNKVRHLADKNVSYASFCFERDAQLQNTGLYEFHAFEQDSAHYLDPTDPNAYAKDSLYRFEIKSWCTGTVVASSQFEIIAKGDVTRKVLETINGQTKTLVDEVLTDQQVVYSISGLFIPEEVVLDGKKFLYVVK